MRQRVLASACLLAAAIASGCASGATTNCKVPPDRPLLLAIRAHAGPITLPNGPQKGNAGRLTITACQTSETDATATMTVFGLANESTLDIRHGVKVQRKAGTWIVTGDAHTRRCQPGHGTQEFANTKCR